MTGDSVTKPTATRGGELVRLVASALRAHSVDPGPVLARVGLTAADASDVNRSVPSGAVYRLVELAAEATHDPAFGLHLVGFLEPRNWGLFYYLTASAGSVREALSVAARHFRVANPAIEPRLEFRPDGTATWENRYLGLRRPELKHAIEFVYAHMHRLLQKFAGPELRFAAVSFEHRRTTELEAFERYFGCPVTFGADADRVTLPKESLDLPLISADDDVHRTLVRLARKAGDAQQSEAPSHRAKVEAELRRLLPGGSAGIEAVADALGMSARSLGRKLTGENTTFSGVLDDVRRALSIQYVARQDLSVGQIARLVGYDDPSAFSIAFRRWTGSAPSEARADPALLDRIAAAARSTAPGPA